MFWRLQRLRLTAEVHMLAVCEVLPSISSSTFPNPAFPPQGFITSNPKLTLFHAYFNVSPAFPPRASLDHL